MACCRSFDGVEEVVREGEEVFFFRTKERLGSTSIDENKGGFRYVFVGEERQRVLVTQRKLKLKTLGDWEIVVAQSKDIEHTKLLRRR